MDPKIVKFYKDNGYRFSDFFDSKRHGGIKLNRAQITAGGIDYYNEIQSGKISPKRISMGWGIIDRAKVARFDDFVYDNEIIQNYKPIIEGLKESVDVWRVKKIGWQVGFWILFGGSFYLLLKFIDMLGGIPL